TWIAVHPNIPYPNDRAVIVALRNARTMVIALIAPEFIVLAAMRQWLASRDIAERYRRKYGWAKTHGFFYLMGGFMLYNGGERSGVLQETASRVFSINLRQINPHRSKLYNIFCVWPCLFIILHLQPHKIPTNIPAEPTA
ncbi:hypothetical protein B0H14DRAFT_2356928, partial [Mycena olivaceomarginata]